MNGVGNFLPCLSDISAYSIRHQVTLNLLDLMTVLLGVGAADLLHDGGADLLVDGVTLHPHLVCTHFICHCLAFLVHLNIAAENIVIKGKYYKSLGQNI